MIIITYIPGQLCNQLFLYSKFIAYSLEYDTKIRNPSFYQYTPYFESTATIGVPDYPVKKSSLLNKGLNKPRYIFWFFLARIINKLRINNQFIKTIYLDWNEIFDMVENKAKLNGKLVLAQGWQFNAKELVFKHRNEIVNYFKPIKTHADNVEKYRINLKPNTVTVGVHIRHGDYNTFEGGKYFYSFEKYSEFMSQVIELFANEGIQFVVCSNVKLDIKHFSGFDVLFGPNHELEDMLVLSKCDYIFGPPSTYTMWASFYGNVPLAKLENKDLILTKASFKRYNE
ncbi:MAG: alpha-1,2-fucosyltransferase [Salinivirgaceae bacterium]|jgi:hypothetical protein|nr:alpha-1,2-fucosyltransferase [Salinivirgaceae bacterium]